MNRLKKFFRKKLLPEKNRHQQNAVMEPEGPAEVKVFEVAVDAAAELVDRGVEELPQRDVLETSAWYDLFDDIPESAAACGTASPGSASASGLQLHGPMSDLRLSSGANTLLANVITDNQALKTLLSYFRKNSYKARDEDTYMTDVLTICRNLMGVDYNLVTVSNAEGELSAHYPSEILIPEYERQQNYFQKKRTNTIYESHIDSRRLKDLIVKAHLARCRARFPVPVILYRGKFICRSGTLSGGPEIYGRSSYNYLFTDKTDEAKEDKDVKEPPPPPPTQSDWALFDRVRSADINLLKSLGVGVIVDFMVEKKKVKFMVNVTSSEKVDKENRYAEFNLISLPYPGCEFFKDYRDHNYLAEGLVFDWTQSYVDASIFVPDNPITNALRIDWSEYTTWDLETITKNYLRLLLRYIQENNSGLLIHCISGWDRTPLFISLIRLSLWADGLIHQTLDASQILYLTIAYDWMLFGHNLSDRVNKGEEIMYFCFNILKSLTGEEFSMTGPPRPRSKLDRSSERPVIRTDSENLMDTLMIENDINGSNVSLSSNCSGGSSVSNKSQDVFGHGSQNGDDSISAVNGNNPVNLSDSSNSSASRSPQCRRTSPVQVPSARLRQRQESLSSLSMGSWQMITGTGSIRESECSDTTSSINANELSGIHDSTNTLIDEDSIISYQHEEWASRKRRLLKVREIFLNCYGPAVGLQFKGESKGLLGNIAEKVGLTVRA